MDGQNLVPPPMTEEERQLWGAQLHQLIMMKQQIDNANEQMKSAKDRFEEAKNEIIKFMVSTRKKKCITSGFEVSLTESKPTPKPNLEDFGQVVVEAYGQDAANQLLAESRIRVQRKAELKPHVLGLRISSKDGVSKDGRGGKSRKLTTNDFPGWHSAVLHPSEQVDLGSFTTQAQ